jgi:CRISPR-associated endoribonuclease Cas6
LELVKSVDSNLSKILHQQSTDKAFTLSPLQILKISPDNRPSKLTQSSLQLQSNRPIPAGTPCWWRVSLLDEKLFSRLMQLWLNINPNQPWQLGGSQLQIVSILSNPQPNQPWAGFTSYSDLFEQSSDTKRQLKLQFCTPTTFRITKYDSALPTSELVFKSLLRRWNQYSEISFSEEIIEPIYPSFFEIKTEVAIDSRSKLIGCIGTVAYQILGEVEPLIIQQINALADFALYAGVGRKTPMGMGMVRRI